MSSGFRVWSGRVCRNLEFRVCDFGVWSFRNLQYRVEEC